MGQGEDRVDVVLLDADRGALQFLQARLVERVAPGLVVGDVPILAPAPEGQVEGTASIAARTLSMVEGSSQWRCASGTWSRPSMPP